MFLSQFVAHAAATCRLYISCSQEVGQFNPGTEKFVSHTRNQALP